MGLINKLKTLIKNEESITSEKLKEVKGVGLLIEACREQDVIDQDNMEDGRISKDLSQKIVVLNLCILMMSLGGTGLCTLSVSLVNFYLFLTPF